MVGLSHIERNAQRLFFFLTIRREIEIDLTPNAQDEDARELVLAF